MNTTYKMLWIDDSEDFIETAQELIEDSIKQNNMVPHLTIYSQFKDYKEKELDNFDVEIFNLYDQIVIDYALSGTTGDVIIRDLRSRNIYTDIVFYSSNYETMKQETGRKKNEYIRADHCGCSVRCNSFIGGFDRYCSS